MNADRIAEVYMGTHGSSDGQRRARRRIHWMCAAVRGTRVLDIGCSQGIASLLLGREGHGVIGVDREQGAIEYARGLLADEEEAVKERVSFRIVEAATLPFEDASFDSVLLGEVLEHQVDPAPIVDEARRCLRADGMLVVTTPYGIFPYHDHKEPVYLGPLLELLGERFSITEIELLDSYLGIAGGVRQGRARRFDALAALGVAEERLRRQDETVSKQRSSIEAQKKSAQSRQQQVEERDKELEARDGELESARRSLGEVEERAAGLEVELGQGRARVGELEEQHGLRVESLERELESAAEQLRERAAALERAEALRPVVEELRSEKEALDAALAERTGELESARRGLGEVEERAAGLEVELGQGRARIGELEEQHGLRVQSLERELESAAEQLRERAAALERAEALRPVVEELRREKEALEAELEARGRERDELSQRLGEREQESATQADSLSDAVAGREQALAEAASQREAADELVLLRDRLSEALERRTREATERTSALEEARSEAETAKAESADLRARLGQLEERGLRLDEKIKDQQAKMVRGEAAERELKVQVAQRETDLKLAGGRERGQLAAMSDSLRSQPTAVHRLGADAAPGAGDGGPGSAGLPEQAKETSPNGGATEPTKPKKPEQPKQSGPNGAATQPTKPKPGVQVDAPRSVAEEARPPAPARASDRSSRAEAEEATRLRPDDPRAWRELAKAHERAKNDEPAADAAMRALALDPGRTSTWTAVRTLARLGPDSRFGEVLDRLKPFSKLDENDLARVRDLTLRAGDHARTLALVEEAERRGATDPEWIGVTASVHWELGAEDKAEALVEPLLVARAPDFELRAAARFFLRTDDADRAWAALTRMASPDRSAMVSAARHLTLADRLPEALDALDEVLMLAPSATAALEAREVASSLLEVVEDRWAEPATEQPLSGVRGRVLHLLQRTFPHHLAGSSVRTHAIGRAQLSAGIDVHVVTQPGFPWNAGAPDALELDVLDGVHYHRLRDPEGTGTALLGQQLRRYYRLLAPLVEELRPAVLHPASTHVNALVALELGKRFDIPVVYEVRGFPEERRYIPKRGSRVRRDLYHLARQLELRCLQRADHITTLAEVMKEHIVERGVDAEKITVVPNAVDLEQWRPIPKDHGLASQLGLAEGTTVVGYISTFAPYDGIEYLLRAVGLLRERGCDVHCLLVGGGSERRFLEQTATSLGLDEHVTFTGVVPHDDVTRYYGLIDVFVVPRTNEPVSNLVTPLKPYEAMATQRAVVVSGTTALREMVDDGRTGLCFEPESAESLAAKIELLAADPGYRDALAQAGREWVVRNRTWEANAPLYEGVYRGLGAL